MVQASTVPRTVQGASLDPEKLCERWANHELSAPVDNDLKSAVEKTFGIKSNDTYVYHAIMSVTLAEVQRAINHGDQSGLHVWYLDQNDQPISSPPRSDIDAYTSIFSSVTSTQKALTSFQKNARKDSVRASVAANLISNRVFPSTLSIPKLKSPQVNPYLDFWTWSCRNLEWAGPDNGAVNIKRSHHILPVFYHHFGCVCPSYESLETMRQLAKGRSVFDLGSGNGYWAYMLRRMGMTVHAVDNGDSLWRTTWIGDTFKSDGAKYLQRHDGGKDGLLLLVYPQVTTHFTKSVLHAYTGSTICVAGTQNKNGFTGFKDMTFDEYMAKERSEFKKIVQTPLPSFAAKDEALFVFERMS